MSLLIAKIVWKDGAVTQARVPTPLRRKLVLERDGSERELTLVIPGLPHYIEGNDAEAEAFVQQLFALRDFKRSMSASGREPIGGD